MEFDLIKEPIQKSINYAQELINQFNQENPEEINFENPQINFMLDKTLKTNDIRFFISKYRALFEKNLNAFNNLYNRNNRNASKKNRKDDLLNGVKI